MDQGNDSSNLYCTIEMMGARISRKYRITVSCLVLALGSRRLIKMSIKTVCSQINMFGNHTDTDVQCLTMFNSITIS